MNYPSIVDYNLFFRRPPGFRQLSEELSEEMAYLQNGVIVSPPNAVSGERLIWGQGTYAVVFQLMTPEGIRKAVRCPLRPPIEGVIRRVDALNKLRSESDSKFFNDIFIDSKFIKEAICIKGDYYDLNIMDWVSGRNLIHHVEMLLKNHKKNDIQVLADKLLDVFVRLQDCQFAHGDISPNNIMIDELSNIKFVDYDTIYLPGLEDLKIGILGQRGYIYPYDLENSKENGYLIRDSGPYMDNFACICILTSLHILSCVDIELSVPDNYLLFTQEDLNKPEQSEMFLFLKTKKKTSMAESLLNLLSIMCNDNDGQFFKTNLQSLIISDYNDNESINNYTDSENATILSEMKINSDSVGIDSLNDNRGDSNIFNSFINRDSHVFLILLVILLFIVVYILIYRIFSYIPMK